MLTKVLTLSQEALDELCSHVSPYSFAHNISKLCEHRGVDVHEGEYTQPTETYATVSKLAKLVSEIRSDYLSNAGDPPRVYQAMALAKIAIETRLAAATLNIPLEDVQEAMIASELAGTDATVAVATMLYGVTNARSS